ncbi:MAG: YciI family protein [Flavobacteriales bacterium]|nr:YciI family protein [Flavobacteriales bacterium]
MRTLTILSFLVLPFFCFSQNNNPNYDEALAKELNADDYGMKSYIFAVLKTGPAKIEDKAVLDSCFAGHFSNMAKLAEEKKLVVAGPYGKNDNDYRGLFIFDVASKEEAQELMKGDPSISMGVFEVEMYDWYGSAALPVYLENHDKIWKQKP